MKTKPKKKKEFGKIFFYENEEITKLKQIDTKIEYKEIQLDINNNFIKDDIIYDYNELIYIFNQNIEKFKIKEDVINNLIYCFYEEKVAFKILKKDKTFIEILLNWNNTNINITQ